MKVLLLVTVLAVACGDARAEAVSEAPSTASVDDSSCDFCPGGTIVFHNSFFPDGGLYVATAQCTCAGDGSVMGFTAIPLANPCTGYGCDPATVDACAYTQCMFAALCNNRWSKDDPPRCWPDGGLPPRP